MATSVSVSYSCYNKRKHSAYGISGNYSTIRQDLGLDRPYAEETRWTCSQEGTGVEPTGEAKERETPAQLETHENGRFGGEASYVERDKRHCTK